MYTRRVVSRLCSFLQLLRHRFWFDHWFDKKRIRLSPAAVFTCLSYAAVSHGVLCLRLEEWGFRVQKLLRVFKLRLVEDFGSSE
jgi:hypothetical protein